MRVGFLAAIHRKKATASLAAIDNENTFVYTNIIHRVPHTREMKISFHGSKSARRDGQGKFRIRDSLAERIRMGRSEAQINFAKHGIDFDSAIEVFHGPIILHRSDRYNEERWTALGYSDDRLILVVFTRRAEVFRIISARRARKNEEREYRNAKVGRPPEGQD